MAGRFLQRMMGARIGFCCRGFCFLIKVGIGEEGESQVLFWGSEAVSVACDAVSFDTHIEHALQRLSILSSWSSQSPDSLPDSCCSERLK